MRDLTIIFSLLISLCCPAWERIPYTSTWVHVHERVSAKNDRPFIIRVASHDTTECAFFKSEVSYEADFDTFGRNFVKFTIGHGNVVDSIITFPLYDDERKESGLSYRMMLVAPGKVKLEYGESESLFTRIFDMQGKDLQYKFEGNANPLRSNKEIVNESEIIKSRFDTVDMLEQYLAKSNEPLEGVWTHYDQDSPSLRVSNKPRYTIAVAKGAEKGYDMILLGAIGIENNEIWKPLTLKGRFYETGFIGIYNLRWLDVNGRPVDTDATVEITGDNLLTLRFPYWDTTVRYVKNELSE